MKKAIFFISGVLFLAACGSGPISNNQNVSSEGTGFVSTKVNDRWTTDGATSAELKGLQNTIENFTLLSNEKKYENLAAYQEFANTLQRHIDRVTGYCGLDPDPKKELCRSLDQLKEPIKVLQGNSLEQSRQAIKQVNLLFSQIDSTFNYSD